MLKYKTGVVTTPMGAKEHKNALWVHQWFFCSFIWEEDRQTIKGTKDRGLWTRPGVLDRQYGFTFDHFVQHILEANQYASDVPSSRRRCIFQWRGAPVDHAYSDDDSEFSNDVESVEEDESESDSPSSEEDDMYKE